MNRVVHPPGELVVRSAVISDDGVYRYGLSRALYPEAGEDLSGSMIFIMLNPSTADALIDDPTIRRCMGFARREGCKNLQVVNLYAFRATDPKALLSAADPVGPDNDAYLSTVLSQAAGLGHPVVAAWGVNAKPDRVARVQRMAAGIRGLELLSLGVTKSGAPRHPLYLPLDAELAAWPA